MKETLNNLEQTIVVAHVMRRILSNFEPHERTKNLQILATRLKKFLLKRERTNKRSFIFATEFERVLWLNATDKYDKHTKILALDFVCNLYDYFKDKLSRFADINEKLMEKISLLATDIECSSQDAYEMEQNDNDLLSTFITLFEPHSGVSLRKSLFAGKKLTIRNNLIIEGKKIASGF